MAAIRKTSIDDLEMVLELNLSLFEYEKTFVDSYNLNWTYSDAGKRYFEKVCGWEGNLFGFAASENNKTVGYIAAVIYKTPYRSFDAVCEIENMFIDEKFRRKGIGKALIEAVSKEAFIREVKRLKVGAFAKNSPAQEFYKKLGFKEHEIILEKEI